MSLKFATNRYPGNKINTTGELVCNNGVLTGLNTSVGKNNALVIDSANCGNIKLEDDIYNLKKGSLVNKLCECETVTGTNGVVSCPNGKFINTLYPLVNKAVCCRTCSPDEKTKTTYTQKKCSIVFKDRSDKNQTCPNGTFLKSISINSSNTKMECCYPEFEGEVEMDDECGALGLNKDKCNVDQMKELKHRCKEYGANNCNVNSLKNLENKCDSYGMRYFNSDENKYKNTDSYMTCHKDNFEKLDKYCESNNIENCNFYEIKDKHVKDLQVDVSNIDGIQDSFENKLKIIPNTFTAKLFIFLSLCVLLLVVILIIYLYRNKE
jgi:hypothetical protein